MIFLDVIGFNQKLGFLKTQNHTLRTCSMNVPLFEVRSRAYLEYFEAYACRYRRWYWEQRNLNIEVYVAVEASSRSVVKRGALVVLLKRVKWLIHKKRTSLSESRDKQTVQQLHVASMASYSTNRIVVALRNDIYIISNYMWFIMRGDM